MKKITITSIAVSVLVFLCAPLFAESVFLRDGSILEGKIVKESNNEVVLHGSNDLDTVIPRARVLRINYHDEYKKIVNIHKADGSVIKGYIVAETRDEYIVRMELNSPKETAVRKKEVDALVKEGKEKQISSKSSTRTGPRYSVALAVVTSILPVWSGSFNDGFQPIDGLGITFVILKSACIVMGGVGIGGGYYWDTSEWYMGIYSLIVVWPLITIADQIFSGVVIYKNNMRERYSVVNDDESTVAFSVYPRMDFMCDRSIDRLGLYGSVDSGINIAAQFRW